MFYISLFAIHNEYFEKKEYDENGLSILIPKASATKEMIQSAFRHMTVARNHALNKIENAEQLCEEMIKLFKASKCYDEKTEEDKKEIIEYLSKHPEIIEIQILVDEED